MARGGRLANKPKQATSGTLKQPRFKSNRPCRSRLMGKDVGQSGCLMSAINRFRTAISDEVKARDQDRRVEAWICFLFALVVAPAAYIQGTPHWPYAAVGMAFTAVWLVLTLSRRNRLRTQRLANKPMQPRAPQAALAADGQRR
jgi:hypothetical protein